MTLELNFGILKMFNIFFFDNFENFHKQSSAKTVSDQNLTINFQFKFWYEIYLINLINKSGKFQEKQNF